MSFSLPMQVEWIKCTNGGFCNFLDVNLAHEHFNNLSGVYIIFGYDKNQKPVAVRLGSGSIAERIKDHRKNADITKYSGLFVTWASVDGRYDLNVEAYLAAVLNPLVGERFPNRTQKRVNLPNW